MHETLRIALIAIVAVIVAKMILPHLPGGVGRELAGKL